MQNFKQIIQELLQIPNNTQKYHNPIHSLQKFLKNNTNLLTTPTSINEELYNYITHNPNTPTQLLQNQVTTLLAKLIETTLECTKKIHGFNHPIPKNINPPIQPQQTTYTIQELQITPTPYKFKFDAFTKSQKLNK
jgi:hypothetical protein